MAIVAKALRKSKSGPAAPAPADSEPQTKDRSGPSPPPAAEAPLPCADPPAAKPTLVRPAPLAHALQRRTEIPAPAPAPVEAAATTEPPPAEEPATPAPPEGRTIEPDMVSLAKPDGPEAELFRLLRTRILFPQNGRRPPRTILVTSALAEEGKSFVAANLAVNIAKNVDEHVLLVDCDLRKPSIHAKFGFSRVKGLSDYLASGLELAPLLLKAGVEKLTLLPSGDPPPNPSELITSARMAALIEELKARYDDRYIILDSPPPLMAPETSAIAKWADGILVVVKYGTSMDVVEDMVSHLDRDKIIGAVINQISQREFRSYSYKKYYGSGGYYRA
jgi:exopolysaccharide/PEP-CTERM locus tyrosine autokinase